VQVAQVASMTNLVRVRVVAHPRSQVAVSQLSLLQAVAVAVHLELPVSMVDQVVVQELL
jgi:hypothetical protein